MTNTREADLTLSAGTGKCSAATSKLVTGALICLALSGCKNHVAWREEVKLGNGEIIMIEREALLEGGGAAWPQGQGSVPRQHIIRFNPVHGKGAGTEWRSTRLDKSTYAELPVVLDVARDKSWFIFTALMLNAGCVQYLKYELRNGSWHEVHLDDPIGTYSSNLSLRAGSAEIDPVVSISAKEADLRDHGFVALQKRVGPRRFECDDLYRGPYPPSGGL